MSLIPGKCFPFLALCKGWCFGVGVQTSHPEPHLTLGGLWVLRDGSSHLLWGKAGTAAAGVAEPEDNPWHFGDI